MRYVGDEGDARAIIAGVWEAPGEQEDYEGRPMVGRSGVVWEGWLQKVGLHRRDVYITNVYPYRPEHNDLSTVHWSDLAPHIEDLHARLNRMPNLRVITAGGNYALHALTRGMYGKVHWQSKKEQDKTRGITTLRGSLLYYTTLDGRTIPIIPTVHPASILRGTMLEAKTSISDWRKIKFLTQNDPPVRSRTHITFPSEQDILSYIKLLRDNREDVILVHDIETWGNFLNCIGFSHHPDWSITIPFETEEDRRTFEPHIRTLLTLAVERGAQYGVFDAYWLNRLFSINVAEHGWIWDSCEMHHALDPFMPHDLAYLSSIYLWEPYWKDEGKQAKDIRKFVSEIDTWEGRDTLHRYCGKDCTFTWELIDILKRTLSSEGILDFYLRSYADLHDALITLACHGIRADRTAMTSMYHDFLTNCRNTVNKVSIKTGRYMYANKDFSTKKLMSYFYTDLRIPKKYKRRSDGTKTATLDDTALRRITIERPEHKELCSLILEQRSNLKQSSFVNPDLLDSDDFMRCSYALNTSAGRLSSKENPMGTGTNLQNPDRKIRRIYIPDRDDWYFLKNDLSTAENRVVDMYAAWAYHLMGEESKARFLVERANSKPWEFDQHRANASIIFGVPEDKIEKWQRNLGKAVTHSCQRDMHGNTLSDRLLKKGDIKSPKECEALINAYHRGAPELRGAYFPFVFRTMMEQGMLINPFGRRLDFGTMRLDQEAARKGYSFWPQSTVADIENRYAIIPAISYCKTNHLQSLPNLQVHDEIVTAGPLDELYDLNTHIITSVERPVQIGPYTLIIPAETAISKSWDGGIEWNRMPTREEFIAAALTL